MMRYFALLFALIPACYSQSIVAGERGLIDAQAYALPSEMQPALTKSVQRFNDTLDNMLQRMAALGISMTVVMPNPQPSNETNPHDAEVLAHEFSSVSDRVVFLGGGGSLNRIIQRAVIEGTFDEMDRRFFIRRAEELLQAGARGFGEIALDKYPLGVDGTQYQHAPADHPLVLLLADIAAEHDVPLVVHMEPIGKDSPRPRKLAESPLPETLQPNIAAFERLLSHNSGTRILWAHAGADFSPLRRPDLIRRLLMTHPNLYLAITPTTRLAGKPMGLTMEDGSISPPWLSLLRSFPDRFLLGSSQFYLPGKKPIHVDYRPKAAGELIEASVQFVNQLPVELANRIGFENAVQLYKLRDVNTKP